jgi:hypothetical protein
VGEAESGAEEGCIEAVVYYGREQTSSAHRLEIVVAVGVCTCNCEFKVKMSATKRSWMRWLQLRSPREERIMRKVDSGITAQATREFYRDLAS